MPDQTHNPDVIGTIRPEEPVRSLVGVYQPPGLQDEEHIAQPGVIVDWSPLITWMDDDKLLEVANQLDDWFRDQGWKEVLHREDRAG